MDRRKFITDIFYCTMILERVIKIHSRFIKEITYVAQICWLMVFGIEASSMYDSIYMYLNSRFHCLFQNLNIHKEIGTIWCYTAIELILF